MGKLKQSNKENKKQPLLTHKEKRAAKQTKKHLSGVTPFLPSTERPR